MSKKIGAPSLSKSGGISKTVSLALPTEMLREMKAAAAARGETPSAWMRDAIRLYLRVAS